MLYCEYFLPVRGTKLIETVKGSVLNVRLCCSALI